MKKFYQSRKSQRSVSVSVIGDKVPLYGSGASLSSNSTGAPSVPVQLKLKLVVKSRAYVLGKLVKPKFSKRIECSVVYDPKKHNVAPMSLKNSCTYNWVSRGTHFCVLLFSYIAWYCYRKLWAVFFWLGSVFWARGFHNCFGGRGNAVYVIIILWWKGDILSFYFSEIVCVNLCFY